MATILSYIQKKSDVKNQSYFTYKAAIDQSLTSNVFNLIPTYLGDLNLTAIGNELNTKLSEFSFILSSSTQIQPIYGFKAYQTPSVVKKLCDAGELRPYTKLENAYNNIIESPRSTTIKISDYFAQYSTYGYLQFETNILQNTVVLNSAKITAIDVVQLLKKLMRTLQNIRKLNYNIYVKQTLFGGSLQMQVCNSCNLRDVNKDNSSQWYHAIFIGPYSKKISVDPTIPTSGIMTYTRSIYSPINNKADSNNDNLNNLIWLKNLESDIPTFDMSSNDGSNGVFSLYRTISYDTFDLESKIDLEKSFQIAPGKLIKAERVLAAIIYIFELWQKNIKTIQCNYFICHRNCHSNSINTIADIPPIPVGGTITYDYSELDSNNITYTKSTKNTEDYSITQNSGASLVFYYPIGIKSEGWAFSATITYAGFTKTISQTKYNSPESTSKEPVSISKGTSAPAINVKFSVGGGSSYKITYQSNGKSITTIKPITYTVNIKDQIITTQGTPSVSGKTFSKWSGADITNGSSSGFVIPAQTAKNITVIAEFSDNTYTITYSNIPSGGVSNNPETAGYNETIILNNPTLPDGYTFTKWSKTSGGTKISSIKITANTTIYCNYTAPATT